MNTKMSEKVLQQSLYVVRVMMFSIQKTFYDIENFTQNIVRISKNFAEIMLFWIQDMLNFVSGETYVLMVGLH